MSNNKPLILYKNEWLSLYKTEKGFIYSQRKNINSTATLCFKKEKDNFFFLIRYQPLPMIKVKEIKNHQWDDLYPCCVTGTIEKGETPIQNAIKEVYEETNYIVTKKEKIDETFCVASTQSNEVVYCFLFNLTHAKKINKVEGDGSIFEKVSKNLWVSQNEIEKILFNKSNLYLSSLSSAYLLFIKYLNSNNH